MSFINELRRRNVIRVAIGYVVAAWLVVQVVETIFPAFGFGDEAVRFVVVAFAVGLIPVVVLSWVFEWTPGGIRKDDGVEYTGPAVAAAAKRWDRIVMVVLAAAVAFFVVEKILGPPADVQPSVTVLPFASAGMDSEREYLATAMAEGVHASLSRVPALVVSAWQAALNLTKEGQKAAAIADILKAPNFLSGTMRVAGDRIRVTARLAETDSDRTIWSKTFDGNTRDVFAIQDEIAAAVANHLQGGRAQAPPEVRRTDPEAYRLTAQAWSFITRASMDDNVSIADRLVEEALNIDPDYPSALNALSFVRYMQSWAGEISEDEAQAVDKEIQERILASDPDNAVRNLYLAWELSFDRGEFAHANQHMQIALRTGLNDLEALRLLSGFARRTGNTDEAIWFSERAIAVDPTCENCAWQFGENLFYAGRFDEAIEAKERLQKFTRGGHYNHAIMLVNTGQPALALEVIANTQDPLQYAAVRAMAYYTLGDSERYAENIAELKNITGSHPHMSLAEVYAFTGDKDLAFEAIQNSIAIADDIKIHLFLPQWDNLRDDARWTAIREQLGMSEAKLSQLDFSKVLPKNENGSK